MIRGRIIKLVRSHGSRWGCIQPDGTSREIFFNQGSLSEAAGFDGLQEGQSVEFLEEPDRVNGTRATGILLSDPTKASGLRAPSSTW